MLEFACRNNELPQPRTQTRNTKKCVGLRSDREGKKYLLLADHTDSEFELVRNEGGHIIFADDGFPLSRRVDSRVDAQQQWSKYSAAAQTFNLDVDTFMEIYEFVKEFVKQQTGEVNIADLRSILMEEYQFKIGTAKSIIAWCMKY